MTTHRASGAYRTLNRALLGLVAYCLAVPFLWLHFGRFLPAALRQCASIRVFGRPCPMCGLTRGMYALMHGDPVAATAFNWLTVPAFCLVIAEGGLRLWLSFARLSGPRLETIRKWDGRIHQVLLAAYLAYAAVFYLVL